MDEAELKRALQRIDGQGYKAYRQLTGSYIFPRFTLHIDHVQGDPFAAPSRLRAAVSQPLAGFGPELFQGRVRQVALEDYLARRFREAIAVHVKGHRGTGKSGMVAVDAGGQEILERTAASASERQVEIRFAAALPASGRRCLGEEARAMLLEEIPRLVDRSLYHDALDSRDLLAHLEGAEDQHHLRENLERMGLVAFVADGAVLPRSSGIDDRALISEDLVRFTSPPQLRVEVSLPNQGRVTGMGIPEGVTLIVGGGFHGKSTLLKAVERAVYSHVPGDGRELVVTRADAVRIRAEDGRRVENVDVRPFIDNLPLGVDTGSFRTPNASGSTSQAANIIEAMELGARLLLIDEDTAATNFMIRDEAMQRLIPREKEPITPFIDQVKNIQDEHGVSTILVMGGSGDYFDVADTVIAMEDYLPRVVTGEARRIAAARPSHPAGGTGRGFGPVSPRAPQPSSIDPAPGGRERISARGVGTLLFGDQAVDLSGLEQLVDVSQTRAIGAMAAYALRRGYIDGNTGLGAVLDRVFDDIATGGIDVISSFAGSDHALPRPHEAAGMLNRLRTLEVRQITAKEKPRAGR